MISIFGFENTEAQTRKPSTDALKMVVFTTKFVLDKKKTITYVFRDPEDGALQFLSNDIFENFEDVAKVMTFEDIIKIDKTLMVLANLPVGYTALRNDVEDRWIIQKANQSFTS